MRSHYDKTALRRGDRLPLLSIAALCVMMSLALQGCGGGGTTQTSATGVLRGTVYTSDGVTPLSGAIVYVPSGRATAPAGAVVWTTSGVDGSFVLSGVPIGTTTVKIEKDSWTHSFNINVEADETLDLPPTTTTMPAGGGLDIPPGTPFPDDDTLDPPPGGPFVNNGIAPINEPPSYPFVDADNGLDVPPPPPF